MSDSFYNRGPGVTGLIFGLIFLAILGAIGMFVFDAEKHLDGSSLPSVIKQQLEEIEDYKHQVETNEETLKRREAVAKNTKKVEQLAETVEKDAEKIEKLKEGLTALGDSVVATSKAMNGYVTEYRTQIRQSAVGEKIPELTTNSGRVYSEVEVRAVSEIGIEVRHADGIGRIPFEELSTKWQERFQYDPEEKGKALARERAAQAVYERAAAIKKESEPEPLQIIDPKTPEDAKRLLRPKVLELAKLTTELGRLQSETVVVETADNIARGSGGGKTAHILDLRKRIQAVESRMAAVSREISQIKAKTPR